MTDAIVLEGPVFKLKERRPVWKAIHVVLLPGKQLVYYANAEDARAQRRALTRPKVVLSAVAMGTGTEFSRLADFGPEAAAAPRDRRAADQARRGAAAHDRPW